MNGIEKRPEWGLWVKARRLLLNWKTRRVAALCQVDDSYIRLIETEGYVPRPRIVEAVARTLGLNHHEALLRAGYAPNLSAADLLRLLESTRVQKLQGPLREAIADAAELSPANRRKVAAFLQGVLAAEVA